MFIADPIFLSRIQYEKGIRSRIRICNKELRIFYPKIVTIAVGNMIRDVYPRIQILFHPGSGTLRFLLLSISLLSGFVDQIGYLVQH
jgi:hypothetical protein